MHLWSINLYNKGGKSIHGKKTVSSTSGAGKTGQLHVLKNNENIISYHIKKKAQNGLKT